MTATKRHPASQRRDSHRSRLAVTLATTVCALALLPAILTIMMVMLAVASAFNEPYRAWTNVLPLLLFPVAYAASAIDFHKMLRSTTVGTTWLWAALFIIVVGSASTPAVWTASAAVAEEWCESQPGGRGYTSKASSSEIPAVCR